MGKCVTHHINTLMMEAEAVSKMLDPSVITHMYIRGTSRKWRTFCH